MANELPNKHELAREIYTRVVTEHIAKYIGVASENTMQELAKSSYIAATAFREIAWEKM